MSGDDQCREHQKRLEEVEALLRRGEQRFTDLDKAITKIDEVRVAAERTEQRTIDFIKSVHRIEIALAGDPEFQIDGLAKEHTILKAKVAAIETEKVRQVGFAAGAGLVGAGVLMVLKFVWSLLATPR